MIIDVPFKTLVEVVPPRGRTARPLWAVDLEPFAIRTLQEDEFPAVAVITQRFHQEKGEQTICSDGRRFFRPAGSKSVEELQAAVHHPDESPFSHVQSLNNCSYGDPVNRADIQGRIVTDKRVQKVAELAAVAARLVICGGRVYEACGEPCFKKVRGAYAVEAVLLEKREFDEDPSSFCRADRLQDIFPPRLPGLARPDVLGSLTILRPDLLRLSPATPGLLKIAADTVSSLGQGISRGVMSATRAEFETFISLREALMVDAEGEPTSDLAEALAKNSVSADLAKAVEDVLTVDPDRMGNRLSTAYTRWREEQDTSPEPDASLSGGRTPR